MRSGQVVLETMSPFMGKAKLKRSFFGLILILAIGFCFPIYAFSETVSLPLTLDYPLLRSLTIYTSFSDPGQTAVLLDKHDGCTNITVSEPKFSNSGSLIRFETKIKIRSGVFFRGECWMPVAWEGYMALYQKPKIDNQKWLLSFETVDSFIYDKDHQPAKIAGIIWSFVKLRVYDYLNSITLDLGPPISDVKSCLLPMFATEVRHNTRKMLDSMRPGKIHITPKALKINILADVERLLEKERSTVSETISQQELDNFIRIWETWDSFLVQMVTALSEKPLSREDHRLLLDLVLETRHRFVAELSEKNVGNDFVREQFVSVWQRLSPVLRKNLGDKPTKNLFGYLAFFTAYDALSALDKIGPSIGIEISRNGLIHLARMLNSQIDTLTYRPNVNEKLRRIFGFEPAKEPTDTILKGDEFDIEIDDDIQENEDNKLSKVIFSIFCKQVWAKARKPIPKLEYIRKWLVPKEGVNKYIKRIKGLLNSSALDVLQKSRLSKKYHRIYQRVVLSTAWQESCFRHFKIKKKRLTYLRSYNGTSVGLMQINERVWRGIYNRDHLRWNIKYNILAGCEIIELYFMKYVLRKMDQIKPFTKAKLAGLIYAMYNGGPGQFKKFLKRCKKNSLYTSDRLFIEKYTWVINSQWDNINKCLIGS